MKTSVLFLCLLLLLSRPDEGNSAATAAKQSLNCAQIPQIALVPMGFTDAAMLHLLQTEISDFYNASVTITAKVEMPAAAWYAPRSRYRADTIIAILARSKQYAAYDKVIAITGKDISTTKGQYPDWGILGLGFCPGKSCVVSTRRLKKSATGAQHLQERTVKVALHELGHTFGIPHCANSSKCLMRDAEGTVKSVDAEEKYLCPRCRGMVK
ncbi:hypothetical protein C7N43_26545 [Sphingobacteriales bacterium UPWRP_1]|nr:hypothetical protein B6N25_14185 [Sphingobacteriales bacterium TSM_CSS]PSJ73957.1 hypothetical protein C7N43_26545 [Sphingobacteriales bacterium UPWRP_1]